MKKTIRVFLFADVGDYEEDFKYHEGVFQRLAKIHGFALDFQGSDHEDFEDKHFDILLFDWGGMSIGNSLMEHFSSRFVKMAEDNPSKYFVVVSRITAFAVNEAMMEFRDTELHNVYARYSVFLEEFEEGKLVL